MKTYQKNRKNILAKLARIWLTRSFKNFHFTNDNDKFLNYSNTTNLGLYVHIPFCKDICNFCPYCKVKYNEKLKNKYIKSLLKEIELVGSFSKTKKEVTSLYFGGGTPALIASDIKKIITKLNKYFDIKEGIGIELHPDNVNMKTLEILRDAGVNKISIGIQSFNSKFQNILGRRNIDIDSIKKTLSCFSFETVSMDFIFALPDQTFEDLKNDIDLAFQLGANHIALYPFINFDFTSSSAKPLPKKQKRELLDKVTDYCLKKKYTRDSIWTFSKNKNIKYSSMTRENYLGFGCSATTLLDDQFKINTFSVEEYCNKVENNNFPTSLTIRFTLRQRMIYYLFWMAYTTKINETDFEKFFNKKLKRYYGFELWLLCLFGFLTKNNNEYSMTLKGVFYYHYYENFYTLAYIDKMWNILRKEPFPENLDL